MNRKTWFKEDFSFMEYTIFAQLGLFAGELLRMVDEGQTISIDEVCDNIENGTIVEFIKTRCGFKNLNVTIDSVRAVNLILKEKCVGEHEARNYGLNNNGLIYIARLIIDDLTGLLYDIKFNDIDPETYRR